jgi:hypothetical protein
MARPHHDRIRLASLIVGRKETREYLARVHENGNKTACTSAVLNFYGISKSDFKFSQTTHDVLRHLNRAGFSAENIGRQKQNKKALGKAIKNLNKFILIPGFYLISTYNHVLLAYLSDAGEMSFPVDTNPVENDLRRVETLHRIKRKKYGRG